MTDSAKIGLSKILLSLDFNWYVQKICKTGHIYCY